MIIALVLAFAPACRENGDVAGRPPAPTDSLYRLYRQLLVDSNAHAVEQTIGCESASLIAQFGPKAGLDSIRVTRKQAYSWRDRSRLNRVLDGLHGQVFDLNEKVCGKFTRPHRDSTPSDTR